MKNLKNLFVILFIALFSFVAQAQTLSGEWQLSEIKAGGKNIELAGVERKPDISLKTKNKLGGTAGCNHYFGDYKILGKGRIKVRDVGSTLMACADEIMKRERLFLDILSKATRFKITKNSLLFSDASGKNQLTFFRKQNQ